MQLHPAAPYLSGIAALDGFHLAQDRLCNITHDVGHRGTQVAQMALCSLTGKHSQRPYRCALVNIHSSLMSQRGLLDALTQSDIAPELKGGGEFLCK